VRNRIVPNPIVRDRKPRAEAELLRLDRQVCFPLHAAARAMVQAYQPLLEPLGLTYPQYLVLMVLWESDGASMKTIGERLFLDSGTLTPLLKRLESASLITRRRATDDERRVEVWLTPAGHKLEREAASVPASLACSVGLEARELVRLRDELRRLLGLLQQAAAPKPKAVKAKARAESKPARSVNAVASRRVAHARALHD
jgi:DNA-binding MarR family transcriptional regulator